jgi:hypothetical protein
MIELTFDEQQELANLAGMPGFRVLCKVLDSVEDELLGVMSDPRQDAPTLLHNARYWQMWRSLTHVIKESPLKVRQEHDRLREEMPEDPAFVDELFRTNIRYPVSTMEVEEDQTFS